MTLRTPAGTWRGLLLPPLPLPVRRTNTDPRVVYDSTTSSFILPVGLNGNFPQLCITDFIGSSTFTPISIAAGFTAAPGGGPCNPGDARAIQVREKQFSWGNPIQYTVDVPCTQAGAFATVQLPRLVNTMANSVCFANKGDVPIYFSAFTFDRCTPDPPFISGSTSVSGISHP